MRGHLPAQLGHATQQLVIKILLEGVPLLQQTTLLKLLYDLLHQYELLSQFPEVLLAFSEIFE